MKYITILLLLSACSTPLTTLKHGNQVVTCGGGVTGSMAGGIIGYHIEKGADEDCVNTYKANGFKVESVHE